MAVCESRDDVSWRSLCHLFTRLHLHCFNIECIPSIAKYLDVRYFQSPLYSSQKYEEKQIRSCNPRWMLLLFAHNLGSERFFNKGIPSLMIQSIVERRRALK